MDEQIIIICDRCDKQTSVSDKDIPRLKWVFNDANFPKRWGLLCPDCWREYNSMKYDIADYKFKQEFLFYGKYKQIQGE